MPYLCVLPPSGFSSPTLRRPHLSPPPAYRGFRNLDHESGKAWGVRAGTHHFSSKRTKRCRHPLGIQDQGRQSIQGPTGRDGVVTSPRDRLRRHLCPRVQAPEHPDDTYNRSGAGLRGLHAGRANSISQLSRRGETFPQNVPRLRAQQRVRSSTRHEAKTKLYSLRQSPKN